MPNESSVSGADILHTNGIDSQLNGFVKEGTVEGEGLILAALAAHVDAVARFLEET